MLLFTYLLLLLLTVIIIIIIIIIVIVVAVIIIIIYLFLVFQTCQPLVLTQIQSHHQKVSYLLLNLSSQRNTPLCGFWSHVVRYMNRFSLSPGKGGYYRCNSICNNKFEW